MLRKKEAESREAASRLKVILSEIIWIVMTYNPEYGEITKKCMSAICVVPQDEVNEAGAKLIIAQKSAVEFQAEVVTLRKKEAESRETASQLKVIANDRDKFDLWSVAVRTCRRC